MGVDTNDLRARARSREMASLNGSSATARLLRAAADEIDALRAEVERLRWRGAEDAPRNGTHFLAWSGGQDFSTHPPTVVHWFADGFYTSVNEIAPERQFNVLWWMPLPAAPQGVE